jgi:hypothetical protein
MLGKAYADYLERIPLQIDSGDSDRISHWRKCEQLTEAGFARLVAILAGTAHLDDLSTRCDLDFDNLAPVLAALSDCGLLVISPDGALTWDTVLLPVLAPPVYNLYDTPSPAWNQFPCDPGSREVRARLIARDHAFRDSVRVGIIGDDDLLSPALAAEKRLHPVVLEGDAAVLDHVHRLASQQGITVETHHVDLRDPDVDLRAVAPVGTFITDPPYSYDGVLTFVYQGLRLLQRMKDNRFYLVVNTMMLGRELHRIEHALLVCGATLLEVRPAANQYPFPKGYSEEQRMHAYLDAIAGGARTVFSSSSSFFIWTAPDPDLPRLRSLFDPSRIYRE